MISDISKQNQLRLDADGKTKGLRYEEVMKAIQRNFSGQENAETTLLGFEQELRSVLDAQVRRLRILTVSSFHLSSAFCLVLQRSQADCTDPRKFSWTSVFVSHIGLWQNFWLTESFQPTLESILTDLDTERCGAARCSTNQRFTRCGNHFR